MTLLHRTFAWYSMSRIRNSSHAVHVRLHLGTLDSGATVLTFRANLLNPSHLACISTFFFSTRIQIPHFILPFRRDIISQVLHMNLFVHAHFLSISFVPSPARNVVS